MDKFDELHINAQIGKDFPYGIPGEIWCTKEGKELYVTKMTEKHIKNCMHMVGSKDPWFAYFKMELERRKINSVSIDNPLIKEYEESLLKYWADGHGDMLVLVSEMQGFLDCLMMQGLIKEDSYSYIIDCFQKSLRAIRKE